MVVIRAIPTDRFSEMLYLISVDLIVKKLVLAAARIGSLGRNREKTVIF